MQATRITLSIIIIVVHDSKQLIMWSEGPSFEHCQSVMVQLILIIVIVSVYHYTIMLVITSSDY